ncbi:hypothetical protein EJ110_NYTH56885 [Nymphaea thermarum]|nr:hypothetical protein EJ110_NYTH56885 [Nymphaea thermarum]
MNDQFGLLSFKSLITKDPKNVGIPTSPFAIGMEFYDFFLLEVLVLTNNSFQGHLLIDFSGLPLLEYLSLGRNHFEGSIPHTLSQRNLSKLKVLELGHNFTYFSIPSELGRLN